ncbi:hypothetical protein [Natrialba asiatica]|uniref:hypothetical protein n=1 Tax=Natrialba asiatica TaxID=64602 RepID=UPI001268DEBD|nr:hypothetical protein [Natrialba asiatica]
MGILLEPFGHYFPALLEAGFSFEVIEPMLTDEFARENSDAYRTSLTRVPDFSVCGRVSERECKRECSYRCDRTGM